MKSHPFGTGWRKIGRREEDLSLDIVTAIRESVGPNIDLANEAHARVDVSTAIRIGKRLEDISPAWYEDPVSHHKRARSQRLPIRGVSSNSKPTAKAVHPRFSCAQPPVSSGDGTPRNSLSGVEFLPQPFQLTLNNVQWSESGSVLQARRPDWALRPGWRKIPDAP